MFHPVFHPVFHPGKHIRRFVLFLIPCTVGLPTAIHATTLTITYGQCAACGSSGGPALQIVFQGINPGTTVAMALINTSASYSPASITTINASADKDATDSQATPFTGTFSSGFRPAIEQDGVVYVLNPAIAGPVFGSNSIASTSFTSGWSTISQTGLTLSQFVQYSFATGTLGAATPNLTDSIEFGLAVISTFNNLQLSNATGETDFANVNISDAPLLTDANFGDLANYQVFSFPVTAHATPEPSTMSALGLGLIGLCWKARKKLWV